MSLTSDDLADIKQLMSSLLNAQEKRLDERFKELENKFDRRFEEQDDKLNEILNAVGGEMSEQNEQVSKHEERLESHEARIVRLEKAAA